MPRSTHRRRYLALLSTGLAGLFAGCTGDSGGGDGGGTGGADTGGGFGSGSGEAATGPAAATGDTGYGGADGSAAAPEEEIGLTAGGAQDIGDFRNNLEEGYLPLPGSLSAEGLFSEYYFDTGGGGGCEQLFCAAYSPAVSPDPLGTATERYFTVGLNSGRSLSDFERPAVNLVVVLDVSGSMDEEFDDYYYDRVTGRRRRVEGETGRRKIAVARDALDTLTRQLGPRDRLGIVPFSESADTLHTLQSVGETRMARLRDRIERIGAGGGTNVEAGIDTGLAMLDRYRDVDRSAYENRIVVVTDAQPNLGDTSTYGLGGTLSSAAERRQHTSFVGVGVDFNPELVDRITSIRGANYYTVRSADQFQRRMGEEFQFMVTPLVFDLSLELDSRGTDVVDVYGTSVDDAATTELVSVPTLFPSPREGGRTRGGVILVQVDANGTASRPRLTASWTTRDGRSRSQRARVTFPIGSGEQYANSGVRKAILLARYGDLLRNWMVYERDETLLETDGGIAADRGIEAPPEAALGRWEQTSEPLTVSPYFRDRIDRFRTHFVQEVDALGDDDLQRELETMDRILAANDRV